MFEDENTLAFLDIHPTSPGHTLVIPKSSQSTTIFDISSEDWSAMMATTHKLVPIIVQALSADGVNLIMNNGEHAGQIIFHPHMHIIPRFKGDNLHTWPSGSYKEGEAEVILQKVRAISN